MKKVLAAIALLGAAAASAPATAESCELEIEGNDRIQFNKNELVVPASCDELTVTLVHVGEMPVRQMGHNWVLTRTDEYKDVAQKGMRAGLENEYLPPDDDRIIAATDLVGGGESTSVTFDVSALEPGGDYTYFCSFPGHYGVMNGKLVIE